ncbi:MAG: hypothetical protein HOD04_00410 [Elusimicrobiaceae bacterium]|nr:hypothetical protein [Elusimicrobiaceae bacterium]
MKIEINEPAKKIINSGLESLKNQDFISRLQKKDATLWKNDEEHKKIINNSLGWLSVIDFSLENADEITSFANEAKQKFEYCVLLGMGGSSLAPEVFNNIFGNAEGFPKMFVLDTTNADWINFVRKEIDIKKTLFIFASKSGGTVEPNSSFKYFWAELKREGVENPGDNFIAITDEGTGLYKLSEDQKFLKRFVNPSDIGGRFSALSYFGMVPASLLGVDVKKFLGVAKNSYQEFLAEDKALSLASLLGQANLEGRDKLTLIMPKQIESFGLWVEQLVAESTGKEGKGILPICGEGLYRDFKYIDDRVFVYIKQCEDFDKRISSILEEITNAGHPLMTVCMENNYDLATQYILWQIATAGAGALMKINPFDQPNVESAKILTKELLKELSSDEKQEPEKLILSENLKDKDINFQNLASNVYKLLKDHEYLAILPYTNSSEGYTKVINCWKDEIFTRTSRPVVFGYGPRYLHSTGQLYKGDGNKGLFIILSAPVENEIRIPGEEYSFEDLCNAQALGDFKALSNGGRSVIKIHLEKPAIEGLKKINNLF